MVQPQSLPSIAPDDLPDDLPTEFDLPYTDDQPVDNELQLLIPFLLRAMLGLAWAERSDWFMGINLGLYYEPKLPAIGPDAFLSIGVPRYRLNQGLRLSYLIWREGVVPQFVLEIVSDKPGGEYADKMSKYANMGVLYYVIYNPNHWRRDKHEPFEFYRLEGQQYVRQSCEPFWMPEVGLGLSRVQARHEGLQREWLYWYDEQGQPYAVPENVIAQERSRLAQLEAQLDQEQQLRSQAEQAQQQAEERLQQLLNQLQQRGINPNDL